MADPQYMLDTDTCIYMARARPPQVLNRMEKIAPGTVCISVISYAELMYGAVKSTRKKHNVTRLQQFAEHVRVLSFDAAASGHYGEIRARLERLGETIGGYDMLIGAHARSASVTLVTNNVREFRRIPNLNVENWVG